jgi:hypothetical protein
VKKKPLEGMILTGGSRPSAKIIKEKVRGKGGEERAAGGLVRRLLGWSGFRVGPVAAFLSFFVLVLFFCFLFLS